MYYYKFWTKVILPEAEAKAHLEICQLSGELARLAATLEVGPDGEAPPTLGGDAGTRGVPTEDVSPGVLEPRLERSPGTTYRSEIRSRRPEQWTKPDGTLRPLRRHRSARRRRCATTLTRAPLRPKRYHPACSNRALSARVAQLTDRRYDLGGPSSGRNLTARSAHSALPDCRVTLASYIEGKKLRRVAQDLTSPLRI